MRRDRSGHREGKSIGWQRRLAVERGRIGTQFITERGSGFVTASVVDPFGNVLGLIYSPHYLEQLSRG